MNKITLNYSTVHVLPLLTNRDGQIMVYIITNIKFFTYIHTIADVIVSYARFGVLHPFQQYLSHMETMEG